MGCENTLQAAGENTELQAKRKKRAQVEELKGLRDIFIKADTDGGGSLDRNEFISMSKTREVLSKFEAMELPMDEPEVIFDVLDEDQVGELKVDTLIRGAMKLKGPPRA